MPLSKTHLLYHPLAVMGKAFYKDFLFIAWLLLLHYVKVMAVDFNHRYAVVFKGLAKKVEGDHGQECLRFLDIALYLLFR